MKKISFLLLTALLVTSCVAKKDFVELQNKHDQAKTELVDTKTNLQKCLIEIEKEAAKSFVLNEQVKSLKEDKKVALKQVENLTVLTQSSSDNIKNVISQLSEKDKYINGVRQAMTQKDSLNLAIKYHLTQNLTNGIQDEDIEVNVEKTVVFISISDKLLFKSGSYNVTDNAYTVLEKIAKVINDQPQMEVMIEGHTDSSPIKRNIIPRVASRSGTLAFTISKPLIKPTAAPINKHAIIALKADISKTTITYAESIRADVATEPIERSKPSTTKVAVTPSAKIPVIETD